MKDRNLINEDLWLAARWRDVNFLLTPDLDRPAGIGLMFEDYPQARQIFSAWRETLGEEDKSEMLRVSVIHGTAPNGKKGYAVHLTTEPMSVISRADKKTQEFLIGSRFRFNEKLSTQNLEWFIASYEQHKRYFLFPMPMKPTENFDEFLEQGIWKTKLHHRSFSEVKPSDIDAIAVPS